MWKTINTFYNRYRELVLYGCIGCSGVALDFLIFAGLTKVGIYYQLANIVSVSVGISNNFFWNTFCNFKKTDRFWRRLIKFYMVGFLGLAISSLSLYLFIDVAKAPTLLAKLVVIVFVTLIQFNLNRLFTFRNYTLE